ncbi:hypothetical protein QJS10_CPB13g01139 [Acorus calamus]|uniref:Uncharacterized protein n=1 Tax=Acorus calamus TaxID=4465 RepID=A0AAV9DJA6_ACOCL|nr:hypothetical protein QJS10_CPB13g01139 [Acorus calamus]
MKEGGGRRRWRSPKTGGGGAGGSDQSIPEEDNIEDSNPTIDKNRSDGNSIYNSHHTDWRTFRANLVAQEQEKHDGSCADIKDASKLLGSKWAHPIPNPEPGCILVATEKLDGVRTFERTVVLLRLGTRDPREGPFRVIINRPLDKRIKHMKPTNFDLATTLLRRYVCVKTLRPHGHIYTTNFLCRYALSVCFCQGIQGMSWEILNL